MSVTNVTIPTTQSFLLVDTRTGPNKVLFLPTASTIQGRYLSIKDYYGNATASTLTISTTGLDRIDQRGIRYTLASSFGSVMLLSDGLRSWNMLGLYEGGDTAIAVGGPPATVTTSLISTGLTNRWLFNAGSGTSIADTVGTLTMYLSGGYTWTSATPNSAITSGSIQFDGSSGKALSTAANSAPFATSNWSISMWIYVTATPSSPYIYWSLDSNAITFFLDNGNWAGLGGPAGCIHVFGSGIGEIRTNSICPTSVWTHVVVVVSSLSMTIYFNSVADTLLVNKTIVAQSASLNSWFGIGPNNFPSNVKMTDVRYYNVALSQTQINQIYAGTG